MKNMFAGFKPMIGNIPKQAKKPLDRSLVLMVILICVFGIIMIWSASMYNAKLEGNEFKYVAKQAKYFLFGLALMYFVSLLDYRYLRSFAPLILLITLGLLVFIAFKPDDDAVKGAVRSISIFGVVIMPAELSKIAVLLFMSDIADKYLEDIRSLKTFIFMLLFTALVCLLIYKQPALSTAAIVAALIICMYFLASGNFGFILAFAGVAAAAIYVFITSNDWRMARIAGYIDPFADLSGNGWQPAQSLMALGSGGIFGQGIGNGRAKLKFLPEPQNDYIFAIIGEELGLIGCCALILAYFILILRIIKIALGAQDTFARLYASGMAVLLSIQIFLNIGVVTNLLPPTGIILPFVSSGGSSLITLMIGMGVVLNISRNRKYVYRRSEL